MRFLPHAIAATSVVMVLPSLVLTLAGPEGPAWVVLLSVLAAMAASLGLAAAGSAIWMRHPGSQDTVFGDLMLWGWLRKYRAERRLAETRALLEGGSAAALDGADANARRELLESLSAALEARDAYTHGHSKRVTRHSERIARELGLPQELGAKVRIAAAVHDVGKIRTPREVLTKPGRLDDSEFEIVKQHPVDGAAMVRDLGDAEITAMVRHHHERLDGTGYPDRLAGDDIPLGARIIAVADTFDAMTSSRPYRAASRHKKALDVLAKEAGAQLDPAAVAAFMRYYSGKRSVAWSVLVVTAPQRLGGWAANAFQTGGAGVVPAAQGIVAAGLAALASMGASTAPANAVADRGARDEGHQRGNATRKADDLKDEAKRRAQRRTADRHGSRPRGPERRQSARPRPGTRLMGRPGDDSGRGRDASPQPGGPKPGSGSGPAPAPPKPDGGGADPTPSPLPKVEVPSVDLPLVEEPELEVPEVEVPEVDVPELEVPDVQIPGI